jgi:hypothetical protein
MTKVTPLKIADNSGQINCIEVAESLLADAKAGKMNGFVAICDCPGNEWYYLNTGHKDSVALLGKLQLAIYRIAERLFSDG